MKFKDTHVNESGLAAIDHRDFAVAQMVDETGRKPRPLFNTYPVLQAAGADGPAPCPERLVVHVDDVQDLATFRRVWCALDIQPSDVPF